MGSLQIRVFCCWKCRKLALISLVSLVLILSSLPEEAYMVKGTSRPLSPSGNMAIQQGEEEEEVVVEKMRTGRTLIGSRPPRCDRKCNNCGHCEPIQVPVVPQHRNQMSKVSAAAARGKLGRAGRTTASHHHHHHHHRQSADGLDQFGNLVPRLEYARGDGLSNYKPMTWKCKCGNRIINP